MRMIEDSDGLEVTQDRGMVMVREDIKRRMETIIIRSADWSIYERRLMICQLFE